MNTSPKILSFLTLLAGLIGLHGGTTADFTHSRDETVRQADPVSAEASAVWGPNGHRITAQIADRHLTKRTRDSVAALVGAASLAQLSTWPDEIRSDPAWAYSTPWHFITIEDSFEVYADGEARYRALRKTQNGNVVEAIKSFERILRGTAPREKKRIALRFLVHFVGDVHQPLHVGRGGDRGGNRVDVHWFDELTNLHKVWDEGIIESNHLSFSEFAAFIDQVPADSAAVWNNSTCIDWMNESFTLRRNVYGIDDLSKHTDQQGRLNLSYAYIFDTMPTVERRLAKGGIRLAALLNSIFDRRTARPTCDLTYVEDTVRLRTR